MARFDQRRIERLAGERIDLARLPDTLGLGRRHDREGTRNSTLASIECEPLGEHRDAAVRAHGDWSSSRVCWLNSDARQERLQSLRRYSLTVASR